MSTGAASAWLASSARRWGVRAPPSVLDLLDAALPFGLTDARYRSELTADGSPLEVSFAADAGASLRFDFEPYEPSTPVEVKRQRAIEWMAQAWPMSGTGTGALQPWLAALEADRFGSARRFGAYRALALDARGTAQTKIYADWNGALPAVLPDRLRTCAEALGVHAATLRPHFA